MREMQKFRKKPVVIDAVRIDGQRWFFTEVEDWPDWVQEAIDEGLLTYADDGGVRVVTLEGTMLGHRGDWLIRGVKGELYPVKPDIFEATYEPVGPEAR